MTSRVEAFAACSLEWKRGEIDACHKPGFVNLAFECLATTIRISTNLYYQTDYPFPGAFVRWQKTLPLPVDCRTFNRLQLPFVSHTGTNMRCDPSNSVAYLTSL